MSESKSKFRFRFRASVGRVRISSASPEADLAAVVWPGVSTIYYPRPESVAQIQEADDSIARLERLRGIRPQTVAIRPVIESPLGVIMAHEIASGSPRVHAVGVGPNLRVSLGIEPGIDADALMYARSECELHARALGLDPQDVEYVLD